MKILPLLNFVLLSFLIDPSRGITEIQNAGSVEVHRRILHQPLFPVDSSPPPSPIEPPPPDSSDDTPDEPFLPEVPTGTVIDQNNQPPPPPPPPAGADVPTSVPIATQPPKPTKRVAVAISVAIVTLGMLSGLAFFLYRYRDKHPLESQKLVGGNSQEFPQESLPPAASEHHYLATIEPFSNRRNSGETTNETSSPYHKLNSLRSSELHRPSPDLQPLPPLTRTTFRTSPTRNLLASRRTSSAISANEETLCSPQMSAAENGENPYLPVSGINIAKGPTYTSSSTPHSRRTSPSSRLSNSSPAAKLTIVPSSSSPPLPPPPSHHARDQYDQPKTPSPPNRRAKFPSPPSPPPNLVLPSSLNGQFTQASKIPAVPPPPPPPPPPPRPPLPATQLKVRSSVTNSRPMTVEEFHMPRSLMTTPKGNTSEEVPVPIAEATQVSSSEPLYIHQNVFLSDLQTAKVISEIIPL